MHLESAILRLLPNRGEASDLRDIGRIDPNYATVIIIANASFILIEYL